eukprot:UN03823
MIEYKKPAGILPLYKELIKLQKSNFFIHTGANKAYYAYMRHYLQLKTPVAKQLFEYEKIDIVGVAHNFGLEHPPAVKRED